MIFHVVPLNRFEIQLLKELFAPFPVPHCWHHWFCYISNQAMGS